MTALWSKERRFQLAWELLRSLKPSRLITNIVNLDQAQDAYELLDKGHEIAVAFKY
jgi:threonine dehydrogenase-like Zn-dependent dehydrogenase